MTTVAQLAEAVQTLLTTTAEATARATDFVQRRSKLGGAAFVQALVFAWLANPQATVEARAQAAAVAGVAISPQGLEQRCTERAAVFLEQLLAQAVRTVIAAEPVVLPLLQRFSAVVLLDSSTVVLPDALGPWWPGCGGATAEHTAAALKLQVRFDLCRGTVEGPLLTDGRTHENRSPLHQAPLPCGALRLADLGFFNLGVFAEMSAQGVYWLSRLLLSTAVFTPDGARCDVLRLLAAQGTPTVEMPVCLGTTHHLPARLLAVRVPDEVVNQRRRRLHADAHRRPTRRRRLDAPGHHRPCRAALPTRGARPGPRPLANRAAFHVVEEPRRDRRLAQYQTLARPVRGLRQAAGHAHPTLGTSHRLLGLSRPQPFQSGADRAPARLPSGHHAGGHRRVGGRHPSHSPRVGGGVPAQPAQNQAQYLPIAPRSCPGGVRLMRMWG